jgi:HEAT repeat protein
MSGGWGITSEELAEFDKIFAVAITLGIRNKKKKAEKVKRLLDWGVKAIKPLLYTVECYIADSSSSDEQIDRRADLASDVIVQIGPKAIPTLIEIAYNWSVNIYINELAKEIIKKIGDEYQIEPIKNIPEDDIYDYDLYQLLKLNEESDE